MTPFIGSVSLSVLIGSATITANVGLMGTSAFLIARAAEHPSIAYLEVAIVGVRFFGLVRSIFRYLERLVSHSLNFKLLSNLRIWLYQRLEPLAPGGLVDFRGGDILERMIEDVEILENFYIRAVSPPMVAIILMAGASIFLGKFSIELGWIILTGLLASAVIIPLGNYLLTRTIGRKIALVKAEMNAALVENLQGMEDLVVYGQAQKVVEKIDGISKRLGASQVKQAVGSGISGGINLLFTHLTLWFALIAAIPLVRSENLDGVMVAVMALIIMACFEATTPLSGAAQNLENSLTSAERILEVSEIPVLIHEPEKIIEIPSGGIRLKISGLWFRYNPKREWILKDLQFDQTSGEKIALVGPSGAGKTSLAQVLLRFYPFEKGTINLNGVDIEHIQLEIIRGRIALVSQSVYLFNLSLRKNLTLANPTANDIELVEILKQVGLKDWLEKLPKGLDTWLGEQGAFMSGGERQRLSLARAQLQNADFVIFDEPTANLDAINAKALMPSLLNNMTDKSVLWITHHLVGLDVMDEIMVMDEGRIIERGRHEQLLRTGGMYSRMWKIQHQML